MAENSSPVPTPRVKGPRVWLDMDQQELDDAYDQTVYAPNQPLLAKRRAAASESVLKRFPPERVAYGPSEHEKLDIYKTHKPNAPVNVYVHGGAWRHGQAKDFAFPAEMFVNAGANFVVLDFVQIQDTGGNLLPMAQQVRSAVAWVYKNAARFGADANRVYITGHSSGAHLSGCALVTDWQKDFGLPPDILKGWIVSQRHVRFAAGAAIEAQRVCEIHRRGRASAQLATPSGQVACADHRLLWHPRNA